MDEHLHDRARERAETVLRECKQLSREGIPQRAARLRREMLQLLQAIWLMKGIQSDFVEKYEGVTLDFAKGMLAASTNTENALVSAIQLLEPLASGKEGGDLDCFHDLALKILTDEWLLVFFTAFLRDKSRDQKVEALNRALNKEVADDD